MALYLPFLRLFSNLLLTGRKKSTKVNGMTLKNSDKNIYAMLKTNPSFDMCSIRWFNLIRVLYENRRRGAKNKDSTTS